MPWPYATPYVAKHLIAETAPGWSLYHRAFADKTPWRSLYLRRTGRRRDGVPKHSYWLSWNGERLARSRDAGILLEHNPDVFAWVGTTCSTHQWAKLLTSHRPAYRPACVPHVSRSSSPCSVGGVLLPPLVYKGERDTHCHTPVPLMEPEIAHVPR